MYEIFLPTQYDIENGFARPDEVFVCRTTILRQVCFASPMPVGVAHSLVESLNLVIDQADNSGEAVLLINDYLISHDLDCLDVENETAFIEEFDSRHEPASGDLSFDGP